MLRTKSLNELVTAGNKIKINDSRIVSILIVRTSRMKIFLKISLNFSRSFLPRFIVTQDLLQAKLSLLSSFYQCDFFRIAENLERELSSTMSWHDRQRGLKILLHICHYFSTHSRVHSR